MKNILFVCLGNICRSPAAEGVFLNMIQKNGRSGEFFVDSAGTNGLHDGEPADSRMIKQAKKRNINLPSISRKIQLKDLEKFDYIICMDKRNVENVKKLDIHSFYSNKIFLFLDFVPGKKNNDVPDPYYGSETDFDHVLDLVNEASIHFLKYIDQHE